MIAIDNDALQQFRQAHRGDVITPEDARYDQARRVWNAMIDRRPALIARPRGAADVVAAVQFARAQQLPLAVRGGAHSIAGRGTCDDGIAVDFCEMKAIRVDPAGRTARAEPGVKWLELGGGFGWLEGTCGMTVDNLLSADVIRVARRRRRRGPGAGGRRVKAHYDPENVFCLNSEHRTNGGCLSGTMRRLVVLIRRATSSSARQRPRQEDVQCRPALHQ